jgi:SecD/SecF fusion protein
LKVKNGLTFSAIVVIVSVISLSTNGLDQGVDFVGGSFQVRFESQLKQNWLKSSQKFLTEAEVKIFGNDNQLKITTKYKVQDHGTEADEENKILFQALKSYYSADLTYDKFVNSYDGKKFGIVQASKVGPTVAEDIKTNAYWRFLELC